MNSAPASSAAVLCSRQDRLALWVEALALVFDDVFAIDTPVHVQRISAHAPAATDAPAKCPDFVTAVFLHTGDRELLRAVLPRGRVVFVFNIDGHPSAEPHEVPIHRRTGRLDFEITSHDVKELAEFAIGRRTDWPSACLEKRTIENLQATAILCQGFLALHASADGQPDLSPADDAYQLLEQALIEMGLAAVCEDQSSRETPFVLSAMPSEVRKGLRVEVTRPDWWSILASPNIEQAAEMEWGAASRDEWLKIQALLAQVRTVSQVTVATVAQAYSALVKRFHSVA